MEGIKNKKVPDTFEENEKLKLWLIPEIYGWLIVVMGFAIFLWLVIAACGYVYEVGLSFDSLFALVQLGEGIGIGGGFIAFGTALRRIVVVQATLCVIFLLITIWLVWFFSMYGEWSDVWKILGISVGVTAPLALCVFLNRKFI